MLPALFQLLVFANENEWGEIKGSMRDLLVSKNPTLILPRYQSWLWLVYLVCWQVGWLVGWAAGWLDFQLVGRSVWCRSRQRDGSRNYLSLTLCFMYLIIQNRIQVKIQVQLIQICLFDIGLSLEWLIADHQALAEVCIERHSSFIFAFFFSFTVIYQ